MATMQTKKMRSSPTRETRSIGSFNHDGLELARRRKHRRGLPLGHIALFALAVVAFKIFLVVQLGSATYGARMTALAEGGMLERVAAKVMILDPVSQWIVDEIRYAVR